jgi:hypothetical protein
MDKIKLIETITPLYNVFKSSKDHLSPCELIEVMWEIGASLKIYIKECGIRPHTLFRDIYGKSEGKINIAQKSYITREFLGRCFRVRNMFEKKELIKGELGNLKSFTAFRESMPFLDNEKYKLSGEERDALLRLLNSDLKPGFLLKEVKLLQIRKINKKNPRTQRLRELEEFKKVFIDFYNEIYRMISVHNFDTILGEIKNINQNYISILSRNTVALTEEGLKFLEFESVKDMGLWTKYSNNLQFLFRQDDAKLRRRFRRLIPPSRIIRLADMLYALTDKKKYINFKQKI